MAKRLPVSGAGILGSQELGPSWKSRIPAPDTDTPSANNEVYI